MQFFSHRNAMATRAMGFFERIAIRLIPGPLLHVYGFCHTVDSVRHHCDQRIRLKTSLLKFPIMASSKEGLMLVLAMLLLEEEEEDES